MKIKEIRQIIERKKGQREEIENRLEEYSKKIITIKKEIRLSEKAQIIIQTVAKKTQSQLKYHISDIVSLALNAIFDDPYKFKIEFIMKRNKTECQLLFERNGETIVPLSASGGGVLDVASFGLRVALWTLQQPKSRNTIILDEPFRFLSADLIPKATLLLKELSKRLKIQFIIVTHIEELAEEADRIFKVKIKKGISHVTL